MSSSKERRSGTDRRQAPTIKYFPILDSKRRYIETDRRSGIERRADPRTTLQFINAKEFSAQLDNLED